MNEYIITMEVFMKNGNKYDSIHTGYTDLSQALAEANEMADEEFATAQEVICYVAEITREITRS